MSAAAVALVVSACGGSGATHAGAACLDDVLASYRSLTGERSPGSGTAYERASRMAVACAGDLTSESCRTAVTRLGETLQDVAASVERGATGLREQEARLDGAAAAAAACTAGD